MRALDEFKEVIDRNRGGEAVGVYSVCSANCEVIQAALEQAQSDDSFALIESTSNQVNQNGGYTGMKPADFVEYVGSIADATRFPRNRILFGGDHLGPNTWRGLSASNAMELAGALVEEYAKAGYEKIHLDASMFLADDIGDRSKPLPDETVAKRTVDLCRRVESVWNRYDRSSDGPVYVIGSEVPVPGGARAVENHITVTGPAAASRTVEVMRDAFHAHGLADAWRRVCAVVVQPGVEFGDDDVLEYNRSEAQNLSATVLDYPGLVYEAHSTDYQTEQGLRDLVRDHFCVLKVGPWLTFAYREALFALSTVLQELTRGSTEEVSHLPDQLVDVMFRYPKYWEDYYGGAVEERAFKCKYSYSDRCRYYWPLEELQTTIEQLFAKLRARTVSPVVLSQYMPAQYRALREGLISPDPHALVLSHIREITSLYARACGLPGR